VSLSPWQLILPRHGMLRPTTSDPQRMTPDHSQA
jgi:hypothetical protein